MADLICSRQRKRRKRSRRRDDIARPRGGLSGADCSSRAGHPRLGFCRSGNRSPAGTSARSGVARSAFHGVPIGIKDIFDTFDMPTAYGSPIYQRISAGNRYGHRRTAAPCRPRHPRQVCHDRVRESGADRRQKSARFWPQPGCLFERLGRRCRRLHGSDVGRLADRRLHHPAGCVLRRFRLQGEPYGN